MEFGDSAKARHRKSLDRRIKHAWTHLPSSISALVASFSTFIMPNSTPNVLLFNPPNTRTSPLYHSISLTTHPSHIITTAGQIGITPSNTIPSDPVEQIRLAFRNLARCLEAAGARVEDIMKLTYCIVDYDHTDPKQRQPSLEFLGAHRPPVTLVPVVKLALPGVVFEVEAVAAVAYEPLAGSEGRVRVKL